MPYSATHKRHTRQRILESARRLFNSKGFAQVSIGEVMENAGLTHGGFYRHFKDKDELYAEAVRWFLCEEAPKPWRRPRRNAHKLRAERIVDAYFSLDHFDDRESCCPLIALPSDTARSGEGVKAAYQDVLQKLLALFQADLGGARPRASAPWRWRPCASVGWPQHAASPIPASPGSCARPPTGRRKLC